MAGLVTRRGFIRGTLAACASLSAGGCGEPAPPVHAKKAIMVKKQGDKVEVKTLFPVPKKKGTNKKR